VSEKGGITMVKLSELKDDMKVINENLSIYTVKDVKNDLLYFEGNIIYTAKEYQASIDARSMLESAIESEYDNMYEDWNEHILDDVIEDDIVELQTILDAILSRSKDQNIAYYQDEEIEIDISH